MEENKEVKVDAAAKQCTCKSDLRAFVIALLTAIIVVSLYHFARGYCQMKRQILRRNICKQQTVLVPCCCCARPAAPGRFMGPQGPKGGPRHLMPPDGRRMHPQRDGKFRGKGFPGKIGPEKPAPAPAPAPVKPAPAPEKPAPAPAPDPAK